MQGVIFGGGGGAGRKVEVQGVEEQGVEVQGVEAQGGAAHNVPGGLPGPRRRVHAARSMPRAARVRATRKAEAPGPLAPALQPATVWKKRKRKKRRRRRRGKVHTSPGGPS